MVRRLGRRRGLRVSSNLPFGSLSGRFLRFTIDVQAISKGTPRRGDNFHEAFHAVCREAVFQPPVNDFSWTVTDDVIICHAGRFARPPCVRKMNAAGSRLSIHTPRSFSHFSSSTRAYAFFLPPARRRAGPPAWRRSALSYIAAAAPLECRCVRARSPCLYPQGRGYDSGKHTLFRNRLRRSRIGVARGQSPD